MALADQPARHRSRGAPPGSPRAPERSSALASVGRRLSPPHDQVLRNQSVGSRWSVAVSGPRLCAEMRIRISSGRSLRIFHEHIKIAIAAEDAGVHQLKLKIPLSPSSVLFHQPGVREFLLWIPVEILHVGMRRRGIEVGVIFLHVLAVISLFSGEPEKAFFQDGVAAVPQRQRKAKVLMAVADAGDAVFAPAVGARAGLVVREVVPRGAVARCSPRGRFPTGVRSGTVPSASSGACDRATPPAFAPHESSAVSPKYDDPGYAFGQRAREVFKIQPWKQAIFPIPSGVVKSWLFAFPGIWREVFPNLKHHLVKKRKFLITAIFFIYIL